MKIILVIEDKAEEQEKAKQSILKRGMHPVIAGNLDDALRIMENLDGKIDGIVTDLHFPEHPNKENFKFSEQLCGLTVIIRAVKKNIPVSVCSDINSHSSEYVKVVIDFIEEKSPFKKIPFTMNSKSWEEALSELLKIGKD